MSRENKKKFYYTTAKGCGIVVKACVGVALFAIGLGGTVSFLHDRLEMKERKEKLNKENRRRNG